MTSIRHGSPANALTGAAPKFVRVTTKALDLVRGLATESRLPVQLVFGLRFAAAAALFLHPGLPAAAGMTGWLLLSVAIYVYNGATDVRADRANGSTRPIAAGRLPLPVAMRSCEILSVAGIALCFAAGWPVGLAALAFAALGYLYSAGRGCKSNALAAALVIGAGAALTYTAGVLAAGRPMSDLVTLLFVSVWVSIACSAKDLSDVDGDALAGRRTLPVVLGPTKAAVALTIGLGVTAAAFLAVSLTTPGVSLAVASVVLAGSIVMSARLLLLIGGRNPKSRAAYRGYMATQYVVNIGLIAGLFG